MTKRFGNYYESNKSKRTRIEELWDDDLDNDAIENCFDIATQISQVKTTNYAEINNISLLPSYNAFQEANSLFASTQLGPIPNPNKKNDFIKPILKGPSKLAQDLEDANKKLTEKEGEIAILRAQIDELKTNNINDNKKHQLELAQKVKTVENDLNAVNTELEFKDLEIVNLKQNLSEIRKIQKAAEPPQANEIIPIENNKIKDVQVKLQPIAKNGYPLRSFNILNIFNNLHSEPQSLHFLHTCISNNVEMETESLQKGHINEKTVNDLKLQCSTLVGYSYEELNGTECKKLLNKLILMSLHLLLELNTYLKCIESKCTLQDIHRADANFLKNLHQISCLEKLPDDKQAEVAGQFVKLISTVLPYCDYTQKYLILGEQLDLDGMNKELFLRGNANYWSALQNVVALVGKIRITTQFTNFLCGCVDFLNSILLCENCDNRFEDVISLLKEILFARPHIDVVCKVSLLLKTASKHSNLINILVKTDNLIGTQRSLKNGVLILSRDDSAFSMFVVLLNHYVFNMNFFEFSPILCENIVLFMYNLFHSNIEWIYQQENIRSECFFHLIKLTVRIIYDVVKQFKRFTKDTISESYKQLIECCLETLHLLSYNTYNVMEKYVTIFAQYQEIENFCSQPAFTRVFKQKFLPHPDRTTDEFSKIEGLNLDGIRL